MTLSTRVRAPLAALMAVLLAGCQSAAFGIANRGAAAPDSSVVYDAQHGLALDVYRPRGSAKATAVIVFFYGGNWKSGAKADYRFVGQRLAGMGILAIVADYRTFPRTTFPGFVEDGAGAVAWGKQHAAAFGGDPDRLYVAGHSAGAQIAALIGTDGRYLAAHAMRPQDLAGVIGLSGPYDFVINGGYEEVFGPRKQWADAQAVNFVNGDEPPFLLIHGTGDKVVEAEDSRELAGKLRRAGARAELVLLPDAGHIAPLAALYRPAHDPKVGNAIQAFVRRPPQVLASQLDRQ